jgi:hypothetical protein
MPMNDNENTPEPGVEIEAEKAQPIISEFLDKFREKDVSIPSNLPTSCQLEGKKNNDILSSLKFLNYDKVFYYFDASNQLFEASPNELSEYFNKRQPWEDYDFCIFDPEMKWCIGITHNDDVILLDPEGVLL